MRIGLVLPALPAYSETFFRSKISGLKNHGHEIILFVNRSDGASEFMECRVIASSKLHGNIFLVALNSLLILVKALFITPQKSFKFCKLNKKDGVSFKTNIKLLIANQFFLDQHLDWLHFGFGTMALGRENVAQTIGVKMAVSFRGYDYYVYPKDHNGCYECLFKKEVFYHVLSDALRQGLIKQGIPNERITKITPAIDLSLFNETRLTKRDNEIIEILSVSRLHPIKGLDFVIRALKLINNHKFRFHMTIVGDGAEKNYLKGLVDELFLTDCITFKGQISHEDVMEHMATSDIYIQYSHEEGFCNAVLEAQAMGCLCVVSDAEGLRENVLDGKTGWVVPKRQPYQLAERLVKVIKLGRDQKAHIRATAISRVKREFGLEKQINEFLNFYEKN